MKTHEEKTKEIDNMTDNKEEKFWIDKDRTTSFAHILVDAEMIVDIKELIYYFEKPWKWEREYDLWVKYGLAYKSDDKCSDLYINYGYLDEDEYRNNCLNWNSFIDAVNKMHEDDRKSLELELLDF